MQMAVRSINNHQMIIDRQPETNNSPTNNPPRSTGVGTPVHALVGEAVPAAVDERQHRIRAIQLERRRG